MRRLSLFCLIMVFTAIGASGQTARYEFSTYFGGDFFDNVTAIALDAGGNILVAGETVPGSNGRSDFYVAKLNAAASAVLWRSGIGNAPDWEDVEDIAVDSSGNVYVAGSAGPSFATFVPRPRANAGGTDGFVAKLGPAGDLIFVTFLGGSSVDRIMAIEIDSAGNIVVAGQTHSTDFPVANAFQPTRRLADAFVTKIAPDGATLLFSTYLGGGFGFVDGSGNEEARDLDVDGSDNILVTGHTTSPSFPVTIGRAGDGLGDAFVTKFSPNGALQFSRVLGGSTWDEGTGIGLLGSGEIIVAGTTNSPDFAEVSAPPRPAGANIFVSRLSADGAQVVSSTLVGGNGSDFAARLALDPAGSIFVTGQTNSADFPAVNALDPSLGGSAEAFVFQLTGSTLMYSSYLGGSSFDYGFSAVAPALNRVILGGQTSSTDFPTANALKPIQSGEDGFITAIITQPVADLAIVKTAGSEPAFASIERTYTLVVTNQGPSSGLDVVVRDVLAAQVHLVSATTTVGTCSGIAEVMCSVGTLPNGGSATITLRVRPAAAGSLTNTASVASAQTDPNVANNSSTTATIMIAPASEIPTITQWTLLAMMLSLGFVGAIKIRS